MIKLLVHGREREFEESEISALIEKHCYFGPKEGEPFKVEPSKIDWTEFEVTRDCRPEELVRQKIWSARERIRANPEYERDFYTLIPVKTWNSMTISELETLAEEKIRNFRYEAVICDDVREYLEWAYRITVTENWQLVCMTYDQSKHFRMVKFGDNVYRFVGGSTRSGYCFPATHISEYDYYTSYKNKWDDVVPKIAVLMG